MNAMSKATYTVPCHYTFGTWSLSDIHFRNNFSLGVVSLPVQRMAGQYYSWCRRVFSSYCNDFFTAL